MILPAARMRAWMMAALPVTALAGMIGHAGGAAAGIALWAALGAALIRRTPARYPKQRRLGFSRLFFACAAGCAAMAGLSWLGMRVFSPIENNGQALLYSGCACFALTACEKALGRALPRRLARVLGCALSALFLFFLWYQ